MKLNLQTLGNLSVMTGVRVVLASASPIQALIDHPGITHEYCNRQAIEILRRDGLSQCANFFMKYLQEINHGVYWADKGWKNAGHYFVPASSKGLWRFCTALEEFDNYFKQAVSRIWFGDFSKAAFYLGAATHMVQDVCVPHHAQAQLFNGHKEYENWVKCNFYKYPANAVKFVGTEISQENWIKANAIVAADLLNLVDSKANSESFHCATATLLPMAHYSTSKLFLSFFEAVIQKNYSQEKINRLIVA